MAFGWSLLLALVLSGIIQACLNHQHLRQATGFSPPNHRAAMLGPSTHHVAAVKGGNVTSVAVSSTGGITQPGTAAFHEGWVMEEWHTKGITRSMVLQTSIG